MRIGERGNVREREERSKKVKVKKVKVSDDIVSLVPNFFSHAPRESFLVSLPGNKELSVRFSSMHERKETAPHDLPKRMRNSMLRSH